MNELREPQSFEPANDTTLSNLVDVISQANKLLAINPHDSNASQLKTGAVIDALSRRHEGDERIKAGFKYEVTSEEYKIGKPQMLKLEIAVDPKVIKHFYTETRLENLLAVKPQEELRTLIGTPDQIAKRPPKRSISRRHKAA